MTPATGRLSISFCRSSCSEVRASDAEYEHAAGAAGGVQDAAMGGLDDLDQQLDDARRRVWTESRERTGAPADSDRRHLTTRYSARIHVP